MRFISAALAITVTALLTACMLSTPNASAGPIANLIVRGFIYDASYDLVEGADVTVTTKDGETVMATYDAVSGPDGYYIVSFGLGEYDFGCTIEVTATNGVDTGENWTVAADIPTGNYVNVTLGTEIPEFGGVYGISMLLTMSGIIAIFIVVGRRRR